MSCSEAAHPEWVAAVVTQYGSVITSRFDPATQPRISFNAERWMRWNRGDEYVAWALDRYADGVARTDLWRLAEDLSTPANRRRAFTATLLWGAGKTSRYYGRHAAALSFDELEPVLEQTVDQIAADNFDGAWSTADRLPGLRFPFFTKWLWIAGIASDLKASPLIFDSRVRRGLRTRDWPWHPRAINDRRRWLSYCNDAAAIGRNLSVTGEWVEYWLFEGAPLD